MNLQAQTNVLIRTQDLVRVLPGDVPVTLVKDASLTINQGEFVAITGPSGSGKSSLLYLLGLLDRPTSGKLWLQDVDTVTLDDNAQAQMRLSTIGFVFQFHFLLPEFTALENVMLPMQRLGLRTPKEMRAQAATLLAQLGMEEHMHKIPKKLSGGQSQRVAIARALANDPPIVFGDEPTGNLDSVSSANVQKILKDLARQHGRTVVVVTHDQDFANTADRIIHIVDGRIQDNPA